MYRQRVIKSIDSLEELITFTLSQYYYLPFIAVAKHAIDRRTKLNCNNTITSRVIRLSTVVRNGLDKSVGNAVCVALQCASKVAKRRRCTHPSAGVAQVVAHACHTSGDGRRQPA